MITQTSFLPRFLMLALLLLANAISIARAADANSTVIGHVSNAATKNFLAGAQVEIPGLGLSVLTDQGGRYVLTGVPAGTHQLVATYTGLDAGKATLTVTAGQPAAQNFDLTTSIYQLQAFTVGGEREGFAAAITSQRNAINVKNVVAIDAYGNLPNMNASELAILLPGVAGNPSDESNIVGFTIRGMPPGFNTINIDGTLMASQGGMARQTRMHTITGSMFENLEVVKGHRPDENADSLGGTINMTSRSPLGIKEKRRVTYNFSARWAPAFTQQIPLREDHRIHPLLNVAYQEKFAVFGSDEPNLGVALNVFYSEQAVGFFSTTRDFQNTTSQPAYVWDYRTQDNYNNRKQSSVNLKFEYRLSPNTKFSANLIYNDAFERFRLRYLFRAFTQNQNTVPNATTSGVIPGFTDRITSVRPIAASTIDITSQMSNFFNRMRHASLGAEHRFGPFDIDYQGTYSQVRIHGGGGDGGVLVNRVTGIGWTLDRTESDLHPRFTQTAGPDISNAASYRPNSLNFGDTQDWHQIRDVRANVRYRLPTDLRIYLKTGIRWREEYAAQGAKSTRYNFTGTNSAQLPTDPTIETFGDNKTGINIPAWHANAVSRDRVPVDSSLWAEDVYFRESTRFTGTRGITETVKAGYFMTEGSFKKLSFLIGVRVEDTEDESYGWTRVRVPSSAADQTRDPVGSAQRDYANNLRQIEGGYSKAFPSTHLVYDFTRQFKGRLSWSTSFGRPPLGNLTPAETVDELNQTLTISNPGLRPQLAENWEAGLEYYFEPAGQLAATWFHKTIDDYFVNNVVSGTVGPGADNGFNGEYSGYTILTRANLGTATVQGWEFSYQQQFTFLPGLLSGLRLSTNLTVIDTHGDFGGTTSLSTGQVAGFIPRTANVILSWRHRGFGARLTANYTSDYIDAYTAATVGRNLYVDKRRIINAGVSYQYSPLLGFSVDVLNITNEPQKWYRGIPDQIAEYRIPGITVTFGVSGRF
ncbi:MAG: TonB-dependent receptor [Verrucomicrobiota bacterium]